MYPGVILYPAPSAKHPRPCKGPGGVYRGAEICLPCAGFLSVRR
nr:MAG TPA: hypothetical protein [Caudoviricetes sp.]